MKFLSFILAIVVASSSALAQSGLPVKIGAILPLSGGLAEYGVAAKNGIELAVSEQGELFKNIEFVYEDSQYDNKTALSIFHRLKASGQISLAYVWGSGPGQAVAPAAEKERFPIMAVSAERVVSAKRNYVVRFCYYQEMASQVLLDYLRSRGFKRFAIVKTELAFINGILDGMKKFLRADESIELVDVYQPSDADFRTTISKLRTKKFDALGVFLMSSQLSQFYRQMDQLNNKAETFSTDFMDSLTVVRDAQGTMNGAVFAAPFVDDKFITRYRAKYGNDFQIAWAANSYEFAMLTSKVLAGKDRSPEADQILQSYKSFGTGGAGVADYEFNDSPEGPGFDFKVVARKVESDSIVDFAK